MPEKEMRWSIIGAAADETKVLCKCSCGTVREVNKKNLKAKITRSCGCLNTERLKRDKPAKKRNTKHGMHLTPEHTAWAKMKNRCSNEKTRDYHRYGGRGLTVCARWQEFEAFIKDMGLRPEDGPDHKGKRARCSIDRIENDFGYWCGKAECQECGPENRKPNCRWGDDKQQQRNRGNNRNVTHNGRTQCIAAWAEEFNIEANVLAGRLKSGWDFERATTEPVHRNILTDEQVAEIKRRYDKGSHKNGGPALGAEFGVSFQTIMRVVAGKIERYA